MSDRIDAAADTVRRWRIDPIAFVRENFDIEPDEWQKDELRAFANPGIKRLADQACAGPGKSAVKAWEGWNFLACYGDKGKHPNGYAMSITGDNLRDNLWKEFAVWQSRSQLLIKAFEWQKEQIIARDHPATWWLRAKTWSKTADTEAQGRTLSGLHSRFILYLIDEAGDIAPSVLRSAEQGLANCEWGKISIAGNPTSHTGMLYHAVNEQSDLWHVTRISGDPDDPKRSPRIDLAWAREQIRTHGRDNPWVMAFILGKFPPSAINALLSPDEVRAAIGRNVPDHAYSSVQKRLGIDVARFGDDRTVIFPRQGLRAFNRVEMRGARTDAIAARVAHSKKKWGSELELIDSTGGYSAGVEDFCRQGGIHLMPINFSSNALDSRYYNRRSELYFKAAEWVKNGGQLPNIPGLIKEACAAVYWFENGQLRVEEKDQIKKKLNGHSPDDWDAFMVTFALPDMPSSVESLLRTAGVQMPAQGALAHDWDPMEERRTALVS
jgi:phage terminase large subunit